MQGEGLVGRAALEGREGLDGPRVDGRGADAVDRLGGEDDELPLGQARPASRTASARCWVSMTVRMRVSTGDSALSW